MRTLKVYEKKDWDKFGRNTPEHYSSYSSSFLERYGYKNIKPENLDKPENQLQLTYFVEGLQEKDLLDLKEKFKNKDLELKKEEEVLLERLEDNRKFQKFYKTNFDKISKCVNFQDAFNILIKE